ncbi:TPA: restriction endonuclease subunit S [Morganella morganii]
MSVEVTETGLNLIPAGYKQTEVGVIPEDWDAVCLGDISEVRMCKRILSGQTKKIGAIPFFKIGTFGGEPDAYITHFLYKEFKAKYSFPNKGDILVSAAGTLGKSVVYDGKPAYFQDSNIVWLEVNKYKLLNEYLYHYYKIIKWASSEGSTIARLYNGIIRASIIALPKINEQIAIATALSDVDALISELEKLIAKKQAIKTATMQQLLTGRTRLPPFAFKESALREDGTPKGTKLSELGEIPEDWEVHSLSSICDVRDGTHDSPKYKDNGIPLVTSKNIVDDILDLSNVSLISPEDAFEIDKRSKVDKGDIIMSMIGTVGSAVLLLEEPKFCIKNVALFKPKKVSGEFLVQLIRSKIFQDYLEDSMDGGIQKFVSLGTLRNMEISLPPKEEQAAIATILSDMDAEIQALNQRLSKTRQIKQGMMQELLTGKTRLIKPSKEVIHE